jgi:hypothetical protein
MRRLPLLLAALAVTFATSSHAYTSGPWGCNLRWDHCYGDGGALNKSFACDTNSGTETLVASFVPAWDIANVSGIEIVMNLASASALLPAWWQYKNAGTCRQGSLVASSAPVDPVVTNCPDWAAGQQAGGLAAYKIGLMGPNTARILTVWAVPQQSLRFLSAGQEYFAQKLTIDHANTVGTGACVGCTTPVCIVLQSVNMTTPNIVNDRWLSGPANQTDSDYATWQGGVGVTSPLGSGCPGATPAKQRTWSEVKALYH